MDHYINAEKTKELRNLLGIPSGTVVLTLTDEKGELKYPENEECPNQTRPKRRLIRSLMKRNDFLTSEQANEFRNNIKESREEWE